MQSCSVIVCRSIWTWTHWKQLTKSLQSIFAWHSLPSLAVAALRLNVGLICACYSRCADSLLPLHQDEVTPQFNSSNWRTEITGWKHSCWSPLETQLEILMNRHFCRNIQGKTLTFALLKHVILHVYCLFQGCSDIKSITRRFHFQFIHPTVNGRWSPLFHHSCIAYTKPACCALYMYTLHLGSSVSSMQCEHCSGNSRTDWFKALSVTHWSPLLEKPYSC